MSLGSFINIYLERNNMSISEFARRCGISKAYVSMIIKGVNPANGEPLAPSIKIMDKIAKGMCITIDELFKNVDGLVRINGASPEDSSISHANAITINVLGRVAAGIPIDAIDEVIDQEEISPRLAQTGEFFGLRIKGDSMSPQIMDGDTVIVRKQEDAESDQIVIAIINGNDGVCKKLRKIAHGLMLISLNPQYDPMVFDYSEIDSIPVKIIGKVVEIRRKL